MKKLEDIADVIVGQIMTRVTVENHDEENLEYVLNPGGIGECCIDPDAIVETYVDKNRIDNSKYAQEGDIVIKLSTPYKCALIESKYKGLLIPSFCALIRIKDGVKNIDKAYLCAIINSIDVRSQLRQKIAGTTVSMVKVTDLRSIEIPIIEQKKMLELGKEYLLSCKKRNLLIDLANCEERLMDQRITSIIREER